MKKIVIWGAGDCGRNACHKMKAEFKIVCFVDNDATLTGKKLFDIPIISATELKDRYTQEMDVIICTEKYFQVSAQLIEMGINEYYVMLDGFLYHSSTSETMMPVELSEYPNFKKQKSEKNILFVWNMADVRTNGIATEMKKAGYKVYLLYMFAPQKSGNEDFSNIYNGEFTFYTANGMINFIENSDFDIVHTSSSSFNLTNIVLSTSKHIVLDVDKDYCKCGTVEGLFLEYVAMTQSDGIIYASQETADVAKRRYGLRSRSIIFANKAVLAEELSDFYDKVKQKEITRRR